MTERVHNVPNPLTGRARSAEPRFHLTRVVDAATFEPIPGARMYVDYEATHAVPRFPDPVRIAVADHFGWIRLRVEPGDGNWFYIDAPGYGPQAELGSVANTIHLRRHVNLPVEVRDPLGRPVPQAEVAYYLGCGHTPDIRRIRTDASGRGTVPGIDPWNGILWPVGGGIEARDWWARNWHPWSTPCVIVGPPGIVIEGVVLAADDQPLAGAYVGDMAWNHGPWTRTDERGRFLLVGVEPFDWVSVDRTDDEYEPECGFVAPPPGRSVIFRVAGSETRTDTTVRVARAGGENVPAAGTDLLLYAVRDGDGFTAKAEVEMGQDAVLRLPPGEYEVVADGRLGAYGTSRGRVRVPAPGRTTIRVPRNPRREVDPCGLREGDEVYLVSALFERDVTETVRTGAIPVPQDVETALQIRRWGRTAVRIVRWPEGNEAPRLEGPPPTNLRWRVVGPDGRAVAASIRPARGKPFTSGGVCNLSSYEMGEEKIEIVPRSPKLAARTILVTFPFGGEYGADVDLGEVRLRRKNEPALRVLLPDGSPAAGARVRRFVGLEYAPFDLDEQGGSDGGSWGEPREADCVEIRAPGFMPFRTRLEGHGPWTLRMLHAASVRLAVTDSGGKPVQRFNVLVDGEWMRGREGRFEVAGLEPGPHRVLVAAEGALAKEWCFVVSMCETRERALAMPGE